MAGIQAAACPVDVSCETNIVRYSKQWFCIQNDREQSVRVINLSVLLADDRMSVIRAETNFEVVTNYRRGC